MDVQPEEPSLHDDAQRKRAVPETELAMALQPAIGGYDEQQLCLDGDESSPKSGQDGLEKRYAAMS